MLQPHTPGKLELLPPPELAPDGNGGTHCLPPPVLAQSAILEQPHLCGLPGGSLVQTGPSALVAQSASELHATPQSPVATSHTGPVALAEQSEFLLQGFSHWAMFEEGDSSVGQTDPAGQLLVAVHPHLFVLPVPLGSWHTLPELEDAQSEAALHTHACVTVLQRAP